MKIGWLIHSKAIRNEHDLKLIESLQALKVPYMVVDWDHSWLKPVTWTDRPVDMVIPYGTIAFMKNIHRIYQGEAFPLFHSALHRWSEYRDALPHEEWLNQFGFYLPLYDLKKYGYPVLSHMLGANSFFIRPNDALKSIEATVISCDEPLDDGYDMHSFSAWVHYAEKQARIANNAMFWIGHEVLIEAEYRFVVANGAIIACSQYMSDGEIDYSPSVPGDAIEYAARMASTIADKLDEPAFVMDVAKVYEGLKVIELNAFSTSGLYCTDKVSVVKNVTRAVASYQATLME